MPVVKEYTIYTFEELSDDAKEKARDWWRASVFTDSSDWEHVFNDVVAMGDILGIEIGHKQVKTVGGDTYTVPKVYFSGFSNQGDGACFEGTYIYRKSALKELKKNIGGESAGDKELLRIAKALQALQKRNFYQLEAKITHSGRYSHAYSMDIDVSKADHYASDAAETELKELLRDFANWIYGQLRAEYDYQTSDEVVDESITANEYTFDETGKRED